MKVNIKNCKSDFPIFKTKINNHNLIYLDNSALTQIPKQVVESMVNYEYTSRANTNRGLHTLSEKSTLMFDEARKVISNFIHANSDKEIVFVKNSTEANNLMAYSWGEKNISSSDVIVLSEADHHSTLLPWKKLALKKGAKILYLEVNDKGYIEYRKSQIDWNKVKLVCVSHASNVVGSINNIKDFVKHIKKSSNSKNKIKFLLDATQTMSKIDISVVNLGIDFMYFSSHKMYGPAGIGVLWVKKDYFNEFEPYFFGGGMVKEVSLTESNYKDFPYFLESGTQNVAGAIGLSSACQYLTNIGLNEIERHDQYLTKYLLNNLKKISDIEIYGSLEPVNRLGIVSFNIKSIPSHDVSSILDMEGIEVRSGSHCAMPWHNKFKINSSVRISFGIYNTTEDIDGLIRGLEKAKKTFLN